MNPQALQQQASQAATQGQQLLGQFRSSADSNTADYNTYKNQASTANQQLQDQTKYMQGAGSGTNLYNTALAGQESNVGLDPAQLTAQGQNLAGIQNQLLAVNQRAGQGQFGLSGPGASAYWAAQTAPLSTAAQQQGNSYGQLMNAYQVAQTGANQSAGLGLQGEQAVSDNLNKAMQGYQAQAQTSAAQAQFYSDLAQKQGGLNAQQQQAYATAIQGYTLANAAMLQAQAAMVSAKAASQKAAADAALEGQQTQGAQYANSAAIRQVAKPGGFDYFQGSTPITREQYGSILGPSQQSSSSSGSPSILQGSGALQQGNSLRVQ